MKIADVKVDQEAQSIQHYKQRAKINMGRERMMVMKRNVIIVKRRDTLQRIVGQKVEAWKGKDHKGEEGQIEIQWLTKLSQCFVVLDILAWCEKMT